MVEAASEVDKGQTGGVDRRGSASRVADGRVRGKRGDPPPGSRQGEAPPSEAAVAARECCRGGTNDSEDPASRKLRRCSHASVGRKRLAVLGCYGHLFPSPQPRKPWGTLVFTDSSLHWLNLPWDPTGGTNQPEYPSRPRGRVGTSTGPSFPISQCVTRFYASLRDHCSYLLLCGGYLHWALPCQYGKLWKSEEATVGTRMLRLLEIVVEAVCTVVGPLSIRVEDEESEKEKALEKDTRLPPGSPCASRFTARSG